jgi:hypothetical protein
MRFRKLRIAWSVVCGIACMLLIALWMLSCDYMDAVYFPISRTRMFVVESHLGRVHFFDVPMAKLPYGTHGRQPASWGVINKDVELSITTTLERALFYDPPQEKRATSAPHGVYVISSAVLAALPWMPWAKRFSLRTLLIATTLVAAVLGLIVWATRQ